MLGVDAVVNGGGFGAQLRMPHRFGVAEFEIEEGSAHFGGCHVEQFGQGQRLAIRAGEQVFGGEFVPGKIAFEGEGGNLHVFFYHRVHGEHREK